MKPATDFVDPRDVNYDWLPGSNSLRLRRFFFFFFFSSRGGFPPVQISRFLLCGSWEKKGNGNCELQWMGHGPVSEYQILVGMLQYNQ